MCLAGALLCGSQQVQAGNIEMEEQNGPIEFVDLYTTLKEGPRHEDALEYLKQIQPFYRNASLCNFETNDLLNPQLGVTGPDLIMVVNMFNDIPFQQKKAALENKEAEWFVLCLSLCDPDDYIAMLSLFEQIGSDILGPKHMTTSSKICRTKEIKTREEANLPKLQQYLARRERVIAEQKARAVQQEIEEQLERVAQQESEEQLERVAQQEREALQKRVAQLETAGRQYLQKRAKEAAAGFRK